MSLPPCLSFITILLIKVSFSIHLHNTFLLAGMSTYVFFVLNEVFIQGSLLTLYAHFSKLSDLPKEQIDH